MNERVIFLYHAGRAVCNKKPLTLLILSHDILGNPVIGCTGGMR